MVDIRFFCATSPSGPQAALDYLTALREAGHKVRLAPIGAMFVAGPWLEHMPIFGAELDREHFVNVVCAPFGMSLGTPLRRGHGAGGRPEDIVYQPSTVFRELWTPDVVNVAIPFTDRDPPEDEALYVSQRYAASISPHSMGAQVLRVARVNNARHVEPEEVSRFLEELK